MYNDSIETLLLRHYGDAAPMPIHLEQNITVSVHQLADERRQQEQLIRNLRENRISRRRAIQLVAISSAGLSLLSTGLASAQVLLNGENASRPALT